MKNCECLRGLLQRFNENPDSVTWAEMGRLVRAGLVKRTIFGFGYRLTDKGEALLRPEPLAWRAG